MRERMIRDRERWKEEKGEGIDSESEEGSGKESR